MTKRKDKSINQIKEEFQNNMQQLADKNDLIISTISNGKEKVIAAPGSNGDQPDYSLPEQHSGRVIISGKIKDLMLVASYKFRTPDGAEHTVTGEKSDGLVHSDLTDAFKKLIPHLICICDQKEAAKIIKAGEIKEEIEYEDYIINGFSIDSTGEGEGVSISGEKMIGSKLLKLTSPLTRWSDTYQFSSELAEVIEYCKHEVQEYLNGKYAVKQTSMDFGEAEEAHEKN